MIFSRFTHCAAWFSLALAGMVAGAVSADEPVPPARLALVSNLPADRVGPLLALAEAEVSGIEQLVVLERQQIDTVLREHRMQLAGLIESSEAIRLGNVLAADILATLDGNAAGSDLGTLGIIVFDARTGVRLADAALGGDGPEKQAGRVAAAVREAVAKRRQPSAALHTISITSFRNVDLPRDVDDVCDAARMLLERRLLASADIAVLDRTHLELVAKERELSGQTEDRLLASVTPIAVEVTRASNGGFRAEASLATAGAAVRRRAVDVAQPDAAALAEALAAAIAESIGGQPPQRRGDRALDARRLSDEARFELSRSRHDVAVARSEAALALNPSESDHLALVAQTRMQRAMNLVVTRQWKQLEMERRVYSDMLRHVDVNVERRARELKAGQLQVGKNTLFNRKSGELLLPMRLSAIFGRRLSEDAEVQETVQQLRQRIRRLIHEQMGPAIVKAFEANPHSHDTLESYVLMVSSVSHWCPSSKEWADEMIAHVDRVVRLAEKKGPWIGNEGLAYYSYAQLLAIVYTPRSDTTWELAYDDGRRLGEHLGKYFDHPLPEVRLFAQTARLWLGRHLKRISDDDERRRVAAIVEQAATALADPKLTSAASRMACYESALSAVSIASELDEKTLDLLYRLRRDMVQRKEVFLGVLEMTAGDAIERFDHYRSDVLRMHEFPSGLLAEMPETHLKAAAADVAVILDHMQDMRFPDDAKQYSKDLVTKLATFYAPQFPDLFPEKTGTLAGEARRCLAKSDDYPDLPPLYGACVEGSKVYYLALYEGETPRAPCKVTLCVADMADGSRREISTLEVKPTLSSPHARQVAYPIRSCQISEGVYYCCFPLAGGICTFPLDGSAPQRLGREQIPAMPTETIDAMCVVGRNILALTSGSNGYVHWYEPDGEGWQVLASSRRAEKKTPLDYDQEYLEAMHYDAPRKRIIFAVRQLASRGKEGIEGGIHQFDIESKKLSRMVHFYYFLALWMGQVDENRLWFMYPHEDAKSVGRVFELDLTNDSWSAVLMRRTKGVPTIREADLKRKLIPCKENLYPPYAACGDRVWSFSPFATVDTTTGKVDEFEPVEKRVDVDYFWHSCPPNVVRYYPDRDALLWANARSIWWITVGKPDAPKDAPLDATKPSAR